MKTSAPTDDATDHNPGTLLRAVHERMGADKLADALAVVRTRRTTLRRADEADEHGVRDAVDQLLTDGQLPADLSATGIAARRRTEAANVEAATINRIETELLTRRRTIYSQRADDGLDLLRDVLHEIVPAARDTVDRLDGATTAEEALDLGVGDAWTEVRDLAHRYRSVRYVQARVVSDAVREDRDAPGTPNREAAYVTKTAQRLVDLAGYIDQPERHVTDVATLFGVGPTRTEPRGRAAVYPWCTGDPWSDLVWLVTSDATPVIPHVAELHAIRERLHALAHDPERAA